LVYVFYVNDELSIIEFHFL